VSAHLLTTTRRGRRDRHICASIHGIHLANLLRFILVVILDNTHGVDPEISETDSPGDSYGVLYSLWECAWVNVPLVFPKFRLDGFGHLIAAPAVAQRSIRRSRSVRGESQPEC